MECLILFLREETDPAVPSTAILTEDIIFRAVVKRGGIDGIAAILDQGGRCVSCGLTITANYLPTDEGDLARCPLCGNPVKIGHRFTYEERMSLRIDA